MTEDEMVGWHCQLNEHEFFFFFEHEFEKAPGDGEGEESLACCSPWDCKESYMTV